MLIIVDALFTSVIVAANFCFFVFCFLG